MKRTPLICLTLLLLGVRVLAQTTFYRTSFEPPAFTPGLPIRGQDGWEVFSDGAPVSVSTNNASSGRQCLRFDGALLEPQASGSSIGVAQLSSASLAALTGDAPPSIVEIQCDVRLDGPQVGAAGAPELDKLSANFYAGDSKYAGGFIVSSAGKIWTASFAPGELYKYSVPYTFGTYRTLTLRVNYLARTLTYLVDGVELGSSPINPSNTDDRLTRADLVVSGPTDPIHTPEIDYDPANYVAYYDNYQIKALPAPVAPEIAVEQGDTSLVGGAATVDFGGVIIGGRTERSFAIRNLGQADLTGVSATVEGGAFAITGSHASTVPPGSSVTLNVTFKPSTAGASQGTLRIASNDSDENSFVIALTGNGLAPEEIAQQAYFKASNTGAADWFGYSVAVSDGAVVIGAPYEDSNAAGVNGNQSNNTAMEAGAAYVFVREGTTWKQQAYLKASNAAFIDRFGDAVAISGDTIVIGAPGEDSSAAGVNGDQTSNATIDSGAAYVFVREGTNWKQQAFLKASNTGANDLFGVSVAVSKDTIVVGSVGEDSSARGINGNEASNSAPESGAAYVFVRNGTTWTQQAYLKASNTGALDGFGFPVSIDGDTIAVGALFEASNATGVNGSQNSNGAGGAGAAYVFVREETNWSQQAYLKASNTGAEDYFGIVALSGDTLVVGAPGEGSNASGVNGNQSNNSAPRSGAAYVFTREGASWSQQAYLKASNPGNHDAFGMAVAASGDTIVIGAEAEDSGAKGVNNEQNNAAENSGAAYVFTRQGTTWMQQGYLKASNTGASDAFGWSVGLSGGAAVVGAYLEKSNARGVNGNQASTAAENAGAAYVFTIPSPPAPEIAVEQGGASLTSGAATVDFGGAKVGGRTERSFTVRNLGQADLTGIFATIEGDEFTLAANPVTAVTPGGNVTINVIFKPSASGLSKGTLRIASNDADEKSFVIALTGNGLEWSTDLGLTLKADENVLIEGAFLQSDGKIVVHANVSWCSADCSQGGTRYFRVFRLIPDGSVDPTFSPVEHRAGTQWYGQTLFPAAEGKFFLVRDSDLSITRYNPDGSLDTTFPRLTANRFLDLKPQPDGKVLVYDRYSDDVGVTLGGKRMPYLFRLNVDGSVDSTFTADATLAGTKRTLFSYYLQPDGKLLGYAANINQTKVSKLFRLNAEGTGDAGFNPGIGASKGDTQSGGGSISSVIFQAGGKLVIGGRFREFNGRPANSIVRLNADGTVDESFAAGRGFEGWPHPVNPNGFSSSTHLVALADGRMAGHGEFLTFDGQAATAPLVLNADGSRADASLPASVWPVASTPDGFVYYFDGTGKGGLGRATLPAIAVTNPIRITSIRHDAAGLTRIAFDAQNGIRYTLQISEDLRAWSDLKSATATGATLEFSDSPAQAARFYRARREQ